MKAISCSNVFACNLLSLFRTYYNIVFKCHGNGISDAIEKNETRQRTNTSRLCWMFNNCPNTSIFSWVFYVLEFHTLNGLKWTGLDWSTAKGFACDLQLQHQLQLQFQFKTSASAESTQCWCVEMRQLCYEILLYYGYGLECKTQKLNDNFNLRFIIGELGASFNWVMSVFILMDERLLHILLIT